MRLLLGLFRNEENLVNYSEILIRTNPNKMKLPTAFLFSLLFFSINIHGQNWLPNESRWEYLNYNFFEGITTPDTNYYEIIGDTLILGIDCKIVEKTYESCDLRPKVEYIHKSGDKLYHYIKSKNEFSMLFDFGIEIGDTLSIPLWNEFLFYVDSIYFEVLGIDNIQVGNDENLKVFNVRRGRIFPGRDTVSFELNHTTKIIENIGNIYSFSHIIEDGWCDGYYTFDLIRFYSPEFGTININDLKTNNINISHSELNIFPNPFINSISIESMFDAIESIEILDNNGQRIGTKYFTALEDLRKEISLPNLNSGLYFLKIQFKRSQEIMVKKILKI